MTIEDTTKAALEAAAKQATETRRGILQDHGLSKAMAKALDLAYVSEKYPQGNDGIFRHAKKQVSLTDDVARLQKKFPEFWGGKSTDESDTPNIDPVLVHSGFVEHNMTSRSRIVREIGPVAALALANRYGLKSLIDVKSVGSVPVKAGTEAEAAAANAINRNTQALNQNNPFMRANWNLTSQSRLVRDNPGLAAQLAALAGVKIGATKPVK